MNIDDIKVMVENLMAKVVAANPHDPIQDDISEIHSALDKFSEKR